jgi:hypothetical protein
MVQPNLNTAGRGRIDEDPFITVVIIVIITIATSRQRMCGSIVLMKGPRTKVGRLYGGADYVSFTDP